MRRDKDDELLAASRSMGGGGRGLFERTFLMLI
jgi:hypothetical protein